MGATNHTPNIELPLFIDSDKPTWRGDFNGAMADIDAEFGTVTGQFNDINTSTNNKVAKGSLFLNVRDYGAIGNGIHDDTVNIQTAVNACIAGGRSLYFPAGTYRVTATITFVGLHYISLVGEIASTAIQPGTTILVDGTNLTCFNIIIPDYNCESFEVHGLSLVTPADHDGHKTNTGFKFTKTTGNYTRKFLFVDVNFSGVGDAILFSSTLVAPANETYYGPIRLIRVHTYDMRCPIKCDNVVLNLMSAIDCLFHGASGGAFDLSTNTYSFMRVINTHFEGCEPAAFKIGTTVTNIVLDGASAESCGVTAGKGWFSFTDTLSALQLDIANVVYPSAFQPSEYRLPRGAHVRSTSPIRVSGEGVFIETPDTITPAVSNSVTYSQTDKLSVLFGPVSHGKNMGTPVLNTLHGSNTNLGLLLNSNTLPETLRSHVLGVETIDRVINNHTGTWVAPTNGFLYVSWGASIPTEFIGFQQMTITKNAVAITIPTGYRYHAHTGTWLIVIPVTTGDVISDEAILTYEPVWQTPAVMTFSPTLLKAADVMSLCPRTLTRHMSVATATTGVISDWIALDQPYAMQVDIAVNNGALGFYRATVNGTGANANKRLTVLVDSLAAGVDIQPNLYPYNANTYNYEIINTSGSTVRVDWTATHL